MADVKEAPKLTCRCSAPNRPIPCTGGCDYLCHRLTHLGWHGINGVWHAGPTHPEERDG